jgi:hypothetical protein
MGAANKFKYKLSARTGQAGSIDIIVCVAHIIRGRRLRERRQPRLADAASKEESASPSCAKDGLKVRSIQSHRSWADDHHCAGRSLQLAPPEKLALRRSRMQEFSSLDFARATHRNALQPTLEIICEPAPGRPAIRRGASARRAGCPAADRTRQIRTHRASDVATRLPFFNPHAIGRQAKRRPAAGVDLSRRRSRQFAKRPAHT